MSTLTATLDRSSTNFTSRSTARALRYAAVAVVLGCAYYAVATLLFAHGIVAADLVFFGEKAALALHGAPPRLVNIGFVYPPLSFLLQLPFGNPLLAQAVIAGLLIAGAIDFFLTRPLDPVLRVLAIAFVVASPVMLYLSTQDYGTLLLCVLLAAGVRYALHFLEDGFSLHLFAAGTLLGLTFFVDFRSVVLLLVVAPALALPLWRRGGTSYAVSIALTVCVPMVFFALAWAYVNWTFLGDPFAYVHGRGSFFRAITAPPALLAVAGDPLATLREAGRLALATLPLTLPYVVGFAWIRRAVPRHPFAAAAIYALPLVLLVSALYGGSFRPAVSLTAVASFVVLFSLDRMRPNRYVMGAALVAAFAASCVAPFRSPDANERAFANVLTARPAADALADDRAVVAQFGNAQRILLDDTSAYALVYLADDPHRFLLPYQYEYASALSNPRRFADLAVVGRSSDDELASLYPGAERGALPGFHEVFRNAAFIVFRRDGAAS